MDLTAILSELELLVVEHLPSGQFVRRGALPSWCQSLPAPELAAEAFAIGDVFPFLETFLDRADRVWHGGPPARASSGFFTAAGGGDTELHLEAVALRVGRAEVLVITHNEDSYTQQQLVLQRARELRLTHDALLAEMEKRDVLLHTVVYDMVSPLYSVLGMLLLLSEQAPSGPAAGWVARALAAATRQQQLIAEVLDVFSAEQDGPPELAADASDVHRILSQVVDELTPAARRKRVRLAVQCEGPSWIAGDTRRLVRTFTNLIDNAIRNSPSAGLVQIRTRLEGGWVFITVDDRGPEVPIDILPRLFAKFAQPGERTSGSPLGLYFCRITVEKWGGGIGYQPHEGGGARFWVRLPLAEKKGH
jgi:signal transduction histidine kinase